MSTVINLEPKIKKRRIAEKDWKLVEEKVKKELAKRETDSFRKIHEKIWREVDRQVYMKNPKKVHNDPKNAVDWHSAIELGELAKASEITTADAVRLIFPTARAWLEAHVELPPQLDQQTGKNIAPLQKDQVFIDGVVRAFMAQQHLDFGFKSRLSLSIKEALHHGSFVAEVRSESAMFVHKGSGIQSLSAPVWVPHSMWNCYPDPSPSVLSSNMLYTGSMIIKDYIPRYKLKEAMNSSEEGWMAAQFDKIPKKNSKNKDNDVEDVELVKYFGDCVIPRDNGDIFLPNSKVILANGIIVFYAPNKLAFPNVIFNGYEKLDVRDPYFTSPLIKNSPMHKAATVMMNKLLDGTALWIEKPIVYDGSDPAFILNGGPVIAPGAKVATKGTADYKTIEVGDPQVALQGVQFLIQQIKSGTGGDASRAPLDTADKTATESRLDAMRGEVRLVDFVDKLEFSVKNFLYMQHEINKQELDVYPFYNPEMDAPDFMRMTKQQLPDTVHFDVVGSKGVLGEEERAQKMSVVTAFASANPLFAPLLKPLDILKEMFQDAGVKNPERFLNIPTDDMQQMLDQVKQHFQQQIQELQAENFDLQKQLAIRSAVNDAKVTEAQTKAQTQGGIAEYKAQIEGTISTLKAELDVFKTAAKHGSEIRKEAAQVSIKEVSQVIDALESMINNDRQTREANSGEVSQKLDTLSKTMQALLEKQSKPIVLKDASGKVLKRVERD